MQNVRRNDPATSRAAMGAILPHLSDLHRRILKSIRDRGGATPYEIMQDTGVIYNTTWRRLSELKKAGLIANSKDKRPNDRGFDETVVVIVDQAEVEKQLELTLC